MSESRRRSNEFDRVLRSLPSDDRAAAFHAADTIEERLDPKRLQRFVALLGDLADRSKEAAAACTLAAAEVLTPGGALSVAELETWVAPGLGLSRASRRPGELATSYFRNSHTIVQALGLRGLVRLAAVTAHVADHAPESAVTFLDEAARVFSHEATSGNDPLLDLIEAVTIRSWPEGRQLIETVPGPLAGLPSDDQRRLCDLAARVVKTTEATSVQLMLRAAESLCELDGRSRQQVLAAAEHLARVDPEAGLEWVHRSPEVIARLGIDAAVRWAELGASCADSPPDAAALVAWVRLESNAAQDALVELSPRVDLDHVDDLLTLYLHGLTGVSVVLRSGTVGGERTSTDSLVITLPSWVETFDERHDNFGFYKVAATHQAVRWELGPPNPTDPRRRFVAGCDDQALGRDLLALTEATRVEARIATTYKGIGRSLTKVQAHEAAQRPHITDGGLRQAFVENLVRISLASRDQVRWPSELEAELVSAAAILASIRAPDSTDEDSAAAAAALYDLAAAIPNVPAEAVRGDWAALDQDSGSTPGTWPLDRHGPAPDLRARLGRVLAPDVDEVEYRSPPPPGFQGVLIIDLDGPGAADPPTGDIDPSSVDPEQLLDLADIAAESEGQGGDASDTPPIDGPELVIEDDDAQASAGEDDQDEPEHQSEADEDGDTDKVSWHWYDEWDFRMRDHRPRWCRVGERRAPAGDLSFYQAVVHTRHGLVASVRRQFERLRPESFRWIRQLEDGHEIDLDRAVMFQADKRAGAGPLARFYSRRDTTERDVAVALLLDVSASTGDAVDEAAASNGVDKQRVIDIEKESAILFAEALEAIGDTYGLFAFSGYGRTNVELWTVKGFDEELDDEVRGRLGGLEPGRSTRMGPAIRHVASKLSHHEAKVRVLILVSDGRPQDLGYGNHPGDREYAVHDTKQALVEARAQGVTPFLVTVDRDGKDYLAEMCGDLGYAVVADTASLPERLPALYRALTTG